MGWTKRQFVEKGFEEIGLASYVFDLTPDQLQSGLWRLDSMMASWNASIRVGYPLPSSPQDSSLAEQTGVPDSANEAIYLNLGIRLAPAFGKTVSQTALFLAKAAYDNLLLHSFKPIERRWPSGVPTGAGYANRGYPFLPPGDDPLLAGNDGAIELN